MTFLYNSLAPWIVSAALVLVLTPLVRRLADRTGMVARPKDDRWHRRTVPLLGGIAVWAATAAAFLSTGIFDPRSLTVLAAATAMAFLGLVDDALRLKPSTKLSVQVAIACFAEYVGLRFDWSGSPTVDALLTIFWIVAVTNAFNLLDNMDGLCAGVAAIAAAALCLTFGPAGSASLIAYAGALAAASAAFLVYNFNPASIFLGDSGSLFIGSSLALLAVTAERGGRAGLASTVVVPVLLLLIPIFDTTFVTLARKLSARSASVGGRDHTSHRLVAMGFSDRHAVLLLYGIAAIGAAAAVAIDRSRLHEAGIFSALLAIALILLGVQLAKVKVYGGEDFSLLRDRAYTPLLVEMTYKRRVFELLLDVCLITIAYYASYVLRFDRDFQTNYPRFLESLPIVIGCQVLSLIVAGVYRGVWRYITSVDITTYARGVAAGVLSSVLALVYVYRFEGYSRGVFLIDAMALMLLLTGSRLSFRVIGELARRSHVAGRRVIIYGAGDGGALLLRELQNNAAFAYQPMAFIDDDASKHRRRILGLPVLSGIDGLPAAIAEYRPDAIIISTAKLPAARAAELERLCFESGTSLLKLTIRLDPVRPVSLRTSAGAQ